MKKTLFLTTLLVVMMIFASCVTQPNDETVNSSNIKISDGVQIETVDQEVKSMSLLKNTSEDLSYKITYDKKIADISVNSIPVQANHIVLNDNRAIVSYNNADNNIKDYAGAIQILELPASIYSNGFSDGKKILFTDRQITSIYENNRELIFGGSQDVDSLGISYDNGEYAFVSIIDNLNTINSFFTPIEISNNLINLPSKTVTGMTLYNGKYYIATGHDSDNPSLDGIYIVKDKKLAEESYNIEDPRAITSNDDYVIVLDGSGKISFINETGLVGSVETNTSITENSKATIEIYKGDLNNVSDSEILLLASFSENGVKGIKVDTSDFSSKIINTLDTYSSNSISTDGELAIATEFGTNSGFRLIEPTDINNSIELSNKKTFLMDGSLYEDLDFSPNYVQYYEKPGNNPNEPFANMLVAMGKYGVGIYEFEKLDDYKYVEDDGFVEIKNLLNNNFSEKKDGIQTMDSLNYDWNYNLSITKDATLQIIFLNEDASWNNSFGYNINSDELLFEGLNNGIKTGYTKEIKVSKGDTIKFFIDPKGKEKDRVYSGSIEKQIIFLADWNRHPEANFTGDVSNGHGYIYILTEDGYNKSFNDAMFIIKVKDDKLNDVIENAHSLPQLNSEGNLE